jgi:hypothetical protein
MVDKADDAIALWQQMVSEMQKNFRSFGDQLSPASRNSSDKAAVAAGMAQKHLADLMESYFAGMNLPSRAQLNAITDRLEGIESTLADIKALLQEALTRPKPAQSSPAAIQTRPKRPPSSKSEPVQARRRATSVPEDADKAE